ICNLQQLAKAMLSKPQLKLTLLGQADAASEAQAWKRAKIEEVMEGRTSADAEGVVRSEKQKLAALKKLYSSTVKERPRNVVGLAKDLPADEMKALIEKDIAIPVSAWQDLAAARAQNVRDYLLAQGVDADRVFLGSANSKSANTTGPSVLLNISVQ
ncbi:MAG TPA: hypothetical protein VIG85_00545, partial [Comamonas sp.]